MALESSKPGKAPISDVLNLTYYRTFQKAFSLFLGANNSTSAKGKLPDDSHYSDPQAGKRPYTVPIALLNANLKLFSKIFANRLLTHISHLVQCTHRPGRLYPSERGKRQNYKGDRFYSLHPLGDPTTSAFINRC